ASEWLAFSYQHQSTNGLPAALAAARRAVEISPEFGFGWARVAELEFSFGRTSVAKEAVERSLIVSPNNAQAYALRGFLQAADSRIHDAIASFDRAIAIDSGLGNAWLGRGLCKRRLGWFGDLGIENHKSGQQSKIKNQKSKFEAGWISDIQTAAI